MASAVFANPGTQTFLTTTLQAKACYIPYLFGHSNETLGTMIITRAGITAEPECILRSDQVWAETWRRQLTYCI